MAFGHVEPGPAEAVDEHQTDSPTAEGDHPRRVAVGAHADHDGRRAVQQRGHGEDGIAELVMPSHGGGCVAVAGEVRCTDGARPGREGASPVGATARADVVDDQQVGHASTPSTPMSRRKDSICASTKSGCSMWT